jgi:hypothetical protein
VCLIVGVLLTVAGAVYPAWQRRGCSRSRRCGGDRRCGGSTFILRAVLASQWARADQADDSRRRRGGRAPPSTARSPPPCARKTRAGGIRALERAATHDERATMRRSRSCAWSGCCPTWSRARRKTDSRQALPRSVANRHKGPHQGRSALQVRRAADHGRRADWCSRVFNDKSAARDVRDTAAASLWRSTGRSTARKSCRSCTAMTPSRRSPSS